MLFKLNHGFPAGNCGGYVPYGGVLFRPWVGERYLFEKKKSVYKTSTTSYIYGPTKPISTC